MKKNVKIPSSLFHYTDQSGLRGIIKTKSLWFTNIFYLNDTTEFYYTFKLLSDELDKKSENDTSIIQFLKDLATYEDYWGFVMCFVCSFSKKSDDLSQWRAYSDDGCGYCIEFDSKKIAEIACEKSLILTQCLYDKNIQRKKIEHIIDEILAAFKENGTMAGEPKLKKIGKDFGQKLLLLASEFKDKNFKEEAEWRLVNFDLKSKGMSLDFRQSKTMLIPYQEIIIAQGAEGSEKMPIKRIIIGPTNHEKLSKKAVEDLLMACSIDCEVSLSAVPYRSKL